MEKNKVSQAWLELLESRLPRVKALKLAKKIHPVMSENTQGQLSIFCPKGDVGERKKYWVESCHIFSESFTYKGSKRIVAAEGLEKVAEITTYHQYPSSGRLCPSVYEVLYQIPSVLLPEIVAFELYYKSDEVVYNSELNRHVLHCVLYRGEIPEEVTKAKIYW